VGFDIGRCPTRPTGHRFIDGCDEAYPREGELGAKSGKGFLDRTLESAEGTRRKTANAFIEIEKWSQDSL